MFPLPHQRIFFPADRHKRNKYVDLSQSRDILDDMTSNNIIPQDTESRKTIAAEIFDQNQRFIYDEDQIAWNMFTFAGENITSNPEAQAETLNREASAIREMVAELESGSFGDSTETIVFQTNFRQHAALYFTYMAEAKENLARTLTNAADYFRPLEDDIRQLVSLSKTITSN